MTTTLTIDEFETLLTRPDWKRKKYIDQYSEDTYISVVISRLGRLEVRAWAEFAFNADGSISADDARWILNFVVVDDDGEELIDSFGDPDTEIKAALEQAGFAEFEFE